MKKYVLLIALIIVSLPLFSQEIIKLMSYNLLNFNNYPSYCTTTNNPHQAKAGYLKTIVANQQPDILCCCEVGGRNPNLAFSISYILGNSLNVDGVTRWQAAPASGNTYLNNALFYDKTKLKLVAQTKVDTDIREINIYKLRHIISGDTLKIAIAHLKAGSDCASDRAAEAQLFMDYLLAQGNNDNFIICGDFNLYRASEPAFQKLINPSYLPIAFYDPVNQIGEWGNNSHFSDYHTQSTRSSFDNECFSGGGMDDRFDFILMAKSIIDGTNGITYNPDSYWAVGQDGNRYNGSIKSPQNNTLPSDVVSALYNMSDHLPIVAELKFGAIGYASTAIADDFQAIVPSPCNDVLTYRLRSSIERNVEVSVYSVMGILLYSEKVQVADDELFTIDCSKLANGMYIVNFRSEGVNQTYRIVKVD